MAFDSGRYASLISRASFDGSYYKGTFQDQSKSQIPMFVLPATAPKFTRVNGYPALSNVVAGDGLYSNVTPAIIDVTQSSTVEVLFRSDTPAGVAYINRQTDPGPLRGYVAYRSSLALVFAFYDAAGLFRSYSVNSAFTSELRMTHVVLAVNNTTVTGSGWVNGVPRTVTVANAGVIPVPITAPRALDLVSVGATALFTWVINRMYPLAVTSEDVAALYGAAKSLVGNEI